ncbi:MAG: PIG-L deacetylase family protein [bacterium]
MKPFSLHAHGTQPTRILCLGAHSDDIEIGCGATLFTMLSSGAPIDVQWIVFGAKGSREEEARRSAAIVLGGDARHEVSVLGFSDSFFPSESAAIKREFEQLKARFDPDVIFTHRGDDRHQDHRVISELTWNTYRGHTILEYEIPKYDGDLGQPNVFVPVGAEARTRKIDVLMEIFCTQRDKRWFSPETFDGLMRIRGIECASPTGYAEGFYARKITLDVGSKAPEPRLISPADATAGI